MCFFLTFFDLPLSNSASYSSMLDPLLNNCFFSGVLKSDEDAVDGEGRGFEHEELDCFSCCLVTEGSLITFQLFVVDPVELSLWKEGVCWSLSEMFHVPLLPALVKDPSLTLLATEDGRLLSGGSDLDFPLEIGVVALEDLIFMVTTRGTKGDLDLLTLVTPLLAHLLDEFDVSLFSSESLPLSPYGTRLVFLLGLGLGITTPNLFAVGPPFADLLFETPFTNPPYLLAFTPFVEDVLSTLNDEVALGQVRPPEVTVLGLLVLDEEETTPEV